MKECGAITSGLTGDSPQHTGTKGTHHNMYRHMYKKGDKEQNQERPTIAT